MARVFVGMFVVLFAVVSLSAGWSLQCPRLPPPKYGSCVLYGDKAVYRCHYGYKLHGVDTRYCRYGKWGGKPPVCLPVCPVLKAPSYGHVSVVGSRAQFGCHKGYKIDGRYQIYCINGQWHGTIPVCRKDERCPRLVNPAYGYVNVRDSWAVYVCNAGYWLDGDSKKKCINGHWVPRGAPRCRRKTDRDESDDDSDGDSDDDSDDDGSDSDNSRGSDSDTDRYSDSGSDSDSNGSDSDRHRGRSYGDSDDSDSGSDGSDDDHHRRRYGQDSDSGSDDSDSDDHRRRYGNDSDSDNDDSDSDGHHRRYGDDSDSDGSDSDGHKRRYGDDSDSNGSDSDNSDDNKHHRRYGSNNDSDDSGSDSEDGGRGKHYG